MIPARWFITLASRLLPAHRRDWADAMQAEFASISDAHDATGFALGCLWTALSERIPLVSLIVACGRLAVGFVTIGYGALFVSFLVTGIEPERNNPYFAWLLPWQIAMAAGHIAAGLCLIFWRPRAFIGAIAFACLPAFGLSVYGVLTSMPHPATYAWPFIPLALLGTAAILLWSLDRYRPRLANA